MAVGTREVADGARTRGTSGGGWGLRGQAQRRRRGRRDGRRSDRKRSRGKARCRIWKLRLGGLTFVSWRVDKNLGFRGQSGGFRAEIPGKPPNSGVERNMQVIRGGLGGPRTFPQRPRALPDPRADGRGSGHPLLYFSTVGRQQVVGSSEQLSSSAVERKRRSSEAAKRRSSKTRGTPGGRGVDRAFNVRIRTFWFFLFADGLESDASISRWFRERARRAGSVGKLWVDKEIRRVYFLICGCGNGRFRSIPHSNCVSRGIAPRRIRL